MIELTQLTIALKTALPTRLQDHSAVNDLVLILESYCNGYIPMEEAQRRITALQNVHLLLQALSRRELSLDECRIAFRTLRRSFTITVRQNDMQQTQLTIERLTSSGLSSIFRSTQLRVGSTLTLLATIATIISVWPIIGPWAISAVNTTPVICELIHRPIGQYEGEGETLIVIATFDRAEGARPTNPQEKIGEAISEEIKALPTTNIRVIVSPALLTSNSQQDGENLGSCYNASMVIWGRYDSSLLTVNFLNRKQQDYKMSLSQHKEGDDPNEATELSNPSAYGLFVNNDLPAFTSFLSLYAISKSYYTKRDFQKSRNIIERAVNLLPIEMSANKGVEEAYFLLGWLYQVEEDLQTAIKNYNKAIDLDSQYIKAYNNRANAYADLGKYSQAMSDYNISINLSPTDAELYYNRGVTYAEQEQYRQAIADYDQAIKYNQEYVDAYYNRGNIYIDLEDYSQAILNYDEAIKLDPKNAKLYNNRGFAYYLLGNHRQAIAEYGQAIKQDPQFALAYHNRGLAHDDLGEYDQAIVDFDQAIRFNPENKEAYKDQGIAYRKRGAAYYDQKNYERAIADFNEAVERGIRNAQIYIDLGISYSLLSDYEQALNNISYAIECEQQNSGAYYVRGLIYKQLNKRDEAIADFKHIIELNNDLYFQQQASEKLAELGVEL